MDQTPKEPRTPARRIANYRRAIRQLQRAYEQREANHQRLLSDWSQERVRADDAERELRALKTNPRPALTWAQNLVVNLGGAIAVLAAFCLACSVVVALCVFVWRTLR